MTEDELRSARAMVARVDIDPDETAEWLEALQAVIEHDGEERATHLLGRLLETARRNGAPVPAVVSTPYVNTIDPEDEEPIPGDQEIEHRVRSAIRWNALAMVVRANKRSSGSAATSQLRLAPSCTSGLHTTSGTAAPTHTARPLYAHMALSPASSPGLPRGDPRRRSRWSTSVTRSTAAAVVRSAPVGDARVSGISTSRWIGPSPRSIGSFHEEPARTRDSPTTRRRVWPLVDGENGEPREQGASTWPARRATDNLVIRNQLQPAAVSTGPVRGQQQEHHRSTARTSFPRAPAGT